MNKKLLDEAIEKMVKKEMLKENNDLEILKLIKRLYYLDSMKRSIDPDPPEMTQIENKLKELGVMKDDTSFIKTHPLFNKINKLYDK